MQKCVFSLSDEDKQKYVLSYTAKSVNEDECVLFITGLHRISMFPTTAFMVAGLLIMTGLFVFSLDYIFKDYIYFLRVFSLVFFVMAIVAWLNGFIKYKCSECSVTSKKVIIKVGFIRTSTTEILLKKIESMQIQQDFIGRALDYGKIVIVGTGGTKSEYWPIRSPEIFYKKVQDASQDGFSCNDCSCILMLN